MDYTTQHSCRLCSSPNLIEVIDLGFQMIQHAFIHPHKETPSLKKYPTVLVRCAEKDCGLVQLKHSIDPKILYEVYWYRSNTNNTMRAHLKQLIEEAIQTSIYSQPSLLDIGCNDGTMLNFAPKDCKKTGIDPSDIARNIHDSIEVINDFFPSTKLQNNTFDIITSIAMFYDVDNPVNFANAIRQILAANGLWVVEVAYLPTMIKNLSYDTICHEHVSYFDLLSLQEIAQKSGLKIVKAQRNNINGGSIRCYLTHHASHAYDHLTSELTNLKEQEQRQRKNKYSHLTAFAKKIKQHKKDLFDLIMKLKQEHKRIHLYGASTKGNTILQYCNIDHNIIDMAADKNPEKWGTKTPGTSIPIVSEEESRKQLPDYYLVLPWSFKKEFIQRETNIRNKGAKMIFPLPRIEIV